MAKMPGRWRTISFGGCPDSDKPSVRWHRCHTLGNEGPTSARESKERVAVPWRNSTSYTFSQIYVILNAPPESGVYALYNKALWVYVGESENIRAQLLQHLNGNSACLTIHPNLSFSFELIPEATRAWRQDELVRELRPICNPWPA
jgi:hypothetical protein